MKRQRVRNHMEIIFPSREANLEFAISTVATFVSQMDPTLDEIEDIKTVVKEAVSNVITHAYPEKLGKVSIKVAIFDDTMEIKVRDWGRGIDNIKEACMPMFTTCPDSSGMGLTIMESFMSSMSVKSIPYKGTTVTMRKTITPRNK